MRYLNVKWRSDSVKNFPLVSANTTSKRCGVSSLTCGALISSKLQDTSGFNNLWCLITLCTISQIRCFKKIKPVVQYLKLLFFFVCDDKHKIELNLQMQYAYFLEITQSAPEIISFKKNRKPEEVLLQKRDSQNKSKKSSFSSHYLIMSLLWNSTLRYQHELHCESISSFPWLCCLDCYMWYKLAFHFGCYPLPERLEQGSLVPSPSVSFLSFLRDYSSIV